MILNKIGSADAAKYPEALKMALDYLATTDFSTVADGVYELDGRDVFATVSTITSKNINETHPEYHKEYVDVQYWIDGGELLGWAPKEGLEYPLVKEEGDLFLLKDGPEGEILIPCKAGDYAVLFPWDIHRPGIAVTKSLTYRKVVVKVRFSKI